MAINFPGPYELRFLYRTVVDGSQLEHTQRCNVALTSDPSPGAAFNNINAVTRGGILEPDLAAVVEAWLTLVAVRFPTNASFGLVELWKYEPLSFQASFISAYSPTVVAGENAINPTIVAAQEVYTFRTEEGGVMKLTWIETTTGPTNPTLFPTGIPGINAIHDFVISSANWVLARDTSYPFAGMRFLGGQNEKTFRLRFR